MADWRYKTKKISVDWGKYTKTYEVYFKNDTHQSNWEANITERGGKVLSETTLKEE